MDEDSRKALQRQKQENARKRQAEGGLTKKEVKRRRSAGEPLPKLPKKKSTSITRAEIADTFKPVATIEESRPSHDLVVIPVFWRNVPGQEEAMVKEALRIKNILQKKAGLDVWVDRTHKRTPGQKLNFWESQGVRWRVEIGPKEAVKYRCVISHQRGVAGDFTTVTKVPNVSTVKCAQLLSKLKDTLMLAKISSESVQSATDDYEYDAKQQRISDENLQCMLHPANDAVSVGFSNHDFGNINEDENENQETWTSEATLKSAVVKDQVLKVFESKSPMPKTVASQAPESKAPEQMNAKERRAMKRSMANASGDALDIAEETDKEGTSEKKKAPVVFK
jgi:hypothetical protein